MTLNEFPEETLIEFIVAYGFWIIRKLNVIIQTISRKKAI